MGDFDDYAGKMHGDHASKKAAYDEQQKRESDERHALWEQGKTYIEHHCLPILTEAKLAYERMGHRVELKK